MGRGRAKAKQIKVARKLKYSAPETDLTALERELRSARGETSYDSGSPDDDGDEEDPYTAYVVDDDDESWASDGRP